MSKARDLANAGTALTTVSATELGYLDGVTSAVQTQLNAKQAVVSGVDDTEIGYLDGVTSAIQTQIDSKIGSASAISPTIVDAKGDIIAASAADTVARLAVGANDTVLTADSSTATGLKWATPAAGGMTLLSTTTLSGASTTISSINQGYTNLFISIYGVTNATSTGIFRMAVNSVAANHTYMEFRPTVTAYANTGGGSPANYFNITGSNNPVNTSAVNTFNISINNYSSTAMRKTIFSNNFYVDNAVGGTGNTGMTVGAYTVSGTAVTSLIFNNAGGNFTAGTVLVYGVK